MTLRHPDPPLEAGQRWHRQNFDTGELEVSKAWLRWAEGLEAARIGDGVVIVDHSALNHGESTEAPEAGDYRVVAIDPAAVRCERAGERWTGCACVRQLSGILYRNLDPFGPSPLWAVP